MSFLIVLKLALAFSLMLIVFALALRVRIADLGYTVEHWREGLGALAAIAFSQLPPILPAKQLKMGASPGYATGLLVMAAFTSILIARSLLGPHVVKVGVKASRAGTILLLLLLGVVGLSAGLIPAISHVVGQGTLLVLALAVAAGVLAGYMLRGKEVGNRKALALAAASRHQGAAIAIATHSLPHAAQTPAAIALAATVSGLICVPLLKLMERP
ncbi:hypothetical protein [Novosphingobium sp. BW1]|uniref:hypothetical protein n=1 Tax=Novosphingobium sp. BW1 TaxID=2592621 RepID=UPI0011DEE7EA|nr:hypothetical protein [Novosphingobium sp. BW1]TYC92329.1 hypothetical protein FMM79_03780 [Novosphingobium sp. BW1]